jgi:chitodextrinase
MSGTFNPLDPIKVKGSGKVEATVAVQASLKLYGVVGPTLDIGPFVRASGSDTVSKDEACIRWSIEAGARAQAGGEVRVLGYSLADYKATLLEYSHTLADGAALKCKDVESPSKVDGGTVQAVSATQLQISWPSATDNVWVSGYTLTRNAKRIGDSSTNALLDTGLRPNTEYCYSVVASDKAGNRSAEGKVFCGKTLPLDVDGPQAPTGLVASPLSTTAIGLSWGQVSDAGGIDGYVVYQNGVEIGRSSDANLKLTKLKPTTRYCYRVAAIDKAGNVGAKSGETCTTTLTTTAWNMKIKCSDSDFYVVEKDVDLDINSNQSLSVVGNATDYNGGAMAYQLLGVYVPTQGTLSGRINWTFASSSNVRTDEFSVGLSTNDTGNSAMRQVQVTGCTTQIRFVRKPAAAVVAPAVARPAVQADRSGSVSGQ